MSSATAFQLAPGSPFARVQPTTPIPPRGPRPALRALEGGRAPGRLARQAVYRRRRLVVAMAALAMAAVLFLLASAALAGGAGGGVPSPPAGSSSPLAVHVVQPGDTLWSIAGEIAPGADVRLTVDQLVRLNGGAPLQVGDRLVLP